MEEYPNKSKQNNNAEGRVKDVVPESLDLLLDRPLEKNISARRADVFTGDTGIPVRKRTYICPYCIGQIPLGTDSSGDPISIKSDREKTVIGTDSWSFQIKYCPKCGRKM